jgi:hypothetical protein
MRLTLDTSCVIDAAQAQPRGPQVDDLVDLARHGRVGLWITEAFTVDQETAPADRHQRNLAWLSARPVIGRIPGPWRLGYSGLEGPDGFTDDTSAAADLALREIILSERLQRGRLDEHDPALLARNRDKVTDVQHLTVHRMAGHDAFVTSDDHDMLRHQEPIRRRTGIVVLDPAEALQLARCRSNKTGALRVIDSEQGQTCGKNEAP